MNAPLIADGASPGLSLLLAVVIGVGFGACLERAGLGSARVLLAQFHGRDFTVLKVMLSALLVAMLGLFWLARLGWLEASALHVPETFVWPQLVGGLLFGTGLAIAGLCPGTACVSAATGRIDGLFVLLGLAAGMFISGLLLSHVADLHDSGARGVWTLAEWLGLPTGTVVAGVVALALLAFAGCSAVQRPRA